MFFYFLCDFNLKPRLATLDVMGRFHVSLALYLVLEKIDQNPKFIVHDSERLQGIL